MFEIELLEVKEVLERGVFHYPCIYFIERDFIFDIEQERVFSSYISVRFCERFDDIADEHALDPHNQIIPETCSLMKIHTTYITNTLINHEDFPVRSVQEVALEEDFCSGCYELSDSIVAEFHTPECIEYEPHSYPVACPFF